MPPVAASWAAPGLGLSIVDYLVQAIGTTIAAASRLGEGPQFTVHLPRELLAPPGCG